MLFPFNHRMTNHNKVSVVFNLQALRPTSAIPAQACLAPFCPAPIPTSQEAGVHPVPVSGAGFHGNATAGPDIPCLQSVWLRNRHPNFSEEKKKKKAQVKNTHIHVCTCARAYTCTQACRKGMKNSYMGTKTHAIRMHACTHMYTVDSRCLEALSHHMHRLRTQHPYTLSLTPSAPSSGK